MSQKIIKSPAPQLESIADGALAKVVRGEHYLAGLEAAEIVAEAYRQAQEIREEGERVRHAVIEAAHKEGYEQGLQHWNRAIAEADSARLKCLNESESELIAVAVRIARKIIGEELKSSPETILSIARECLRKAGREQFLKIRLAAADLEQVRARVNGWKDTVAPGKTIELVSDPLVQPGGCIVESEYSVIDAQLDTQIRCMEAMLQQMSRQQ
jgi:type III secretion protein L